MHDQNIHYLGLVLAERGVHVRFLANVPPELPRAPSAFVKDADDVELLVLSHVVLGSAILIAQGNRDFRHRPVVP